MTARDDPFGEIEQVFDQLTQFGSSLTGQLPVDVLDDGDAIVVIAELPGRDPTDMSVELSDGRTLTIEAEQSVTETTEDETGKYIIRERSQSAVSRTLTLPERVTEDGTTATYDDGILTVTLPKPTADSDGTTIPVE